MKSWTGTSALSMTCLLYTSKDGEPAGAVLVLMDVTEQEKREELRREFTANVSHELKTPLTAISGIAEIMQGGMVKPEAVSYTHLDVYKRQVYSPGKVYFDLVSPLASSEIL